MKASTGIMIAVGLGALFLYANSGTTQTPPVDPMPPVDPVEFEEPDNLILDVEPVEFDLQPSSPSDFDFYFPVVQGPRVAGGL